MQNFRQLEKGLLCILQSAGKASWKILQCFIPTKIFQMLVHILHLNTWNICTLEQTLNLISSNVFFLFTFRKEISVVLLFECHLRKHIKFVAYLIVACGITIGSWIRYLILFTLHQDLTLKFLERKLLLRSQREKKELIITVDKCNGKRTKQGKKKLIIDYVTVKKRRS